MDLDARFNTLNPYLLLKMSEANAASVTNAANGNNAITISAAANVGSPTYEQGGGGAPNTDGAYTTDAANIDGAVGNLGKHTSFAASTDAIQIGACPGLIPAIKTTGLAVLAIFRHRTDFVNHRFLCGCYEDAGTSPGGGSYKRGFDIVLGGRNNFAGYPYAVYPGASSAACLRMADDTPHMQAWNFTHGGSFVGVDGIWRLGVFIFDARSTPNALCSFDNISLGLEATLPTCTDGTASGTYSNLSAGSFTIGGSSIGATLGGRGLIGDVGRICIAPATAVLSGGAIDQAIVDAIMSDAWYSWRGKRKVVHYHNYKSAAAVSTSTGSSVAPTVQGDLIRAAYDLSGCAGQSVEVGSTVSPSAQFRGGKLIGAGFTSDTWAAAATASSRKGLTINATSRNINRAFYSAFVVHRPIAVNQIGFTNPNLVLYGSIAGEYTRLSIIGGRLKVINTGDSSRGPTTAAFPLVRTWPGRATFGGVSVGVTDSAGAIGTGNVRYFQDGEVGQYSGAAAYGGTISTLSKGGTIGSGGTHGDEYYGIIESQIVSDCPAQNDTQVASMYADWLTENGFEAPAFLVVLAGDSITRLQQASDFNGWQTYLFGTNSERGHYCSVGDGSTHWDNQGTDSNLWDENFNAPIYSLKSIINGYGAKVIGSATYADVYALVTAGVNDGNNRSGAITAAHLQTDLTSCVGALTGLGISTSKIYIQKLYNNCGATNKAAVNAFMDAGVGVTWAGVVDPGTVDLSDGGGDGSLHMGNTGHAQIGAAWSVSLAGLNISGNVSVVNSTATTMLLLID